MLTVEDGRLITDDEEIKEEILDFYRKLLGSRATELPGVLKVCHYRLESH